jgi:hypothetical protein
MQARLSFTLSQYGVTIHSNITSVYWPLTCFLWSKNCKHSSSKHGLCCFSSSRPRLSLAEILIFSLIVFQDYLCPHYHLNSPKLQTSLRLCNHQIVFSITVSSPERSFIKCTQMPSPLYQYVIHPVVNLPIRRGPRVLMNVSVREHGALKNQVFGRGKFYYSTPIIITILI